MSARHFFEFHPFKNGRGWRFVQSYPADTREQIKQVWDLCTARKAEGLKGLFVEASNLQRAKAHLQSPSINPQKLNSFYVSTDYSFEPSSGAHT